MSEERESAGRFANEGFKSRFRDGRFYGRWREEEDDKGRRPGRLFKAFKAFVLLILMGLTAYSMLNKTSFEESFWFPVAIAVFVLALVTLFVRGYYADVPVAGWFLVGCMVVLVGVKGLSLTWTLSDTETISETLRAAMYLGFFLLALGSLSSERQVAPMMDIAILIVVAVAGYGMFQKIYPLEYPVASLDGVRMDSTLGYSNTTAAVLGMGIALVLARMTGSFNILLRGVMAVFLVTFAVALYTTVSRGGIGALVVAVLVMFVLFRHRLQMFMNIVLAAIPFGWLLYEIRGLEGLFGSGASDEVRVADGLLLRNDLLIALAVALVLQVAYAFFVKRYELMPLGKRAAGVVSVSLILLVAVAGGVFAVSHYGGPQQTVQAVTNNPVQTDNTVGRLTSLSIGFRADYWRVAWDYWREHFLTGSGAGTFSLVWTENRDVDTGVQQVHNVYLEQGVETGVVAFVALAAFAVGLGALLLRESFRAEGLRNTLLVGLLGAVTVYLVSSAIEWHWYIPPSTMFFFVLAGIAATYAGRPSLSESDDVSSAPVSQDTSEMETTRA